MPALAGATFTFDGLQVQAQAGVRKRGGSTAVERDDLWHLGSCTKAMTASLLATFVQEKKFGWDDPLASLLPVLPDGADAAWKGMTLRQLLSHRSGAPANAKWSALPRATDRLAILKKHCTAAPEHAPGSKYLYSNLGYMIAGLVAEHHGKALWEDLMRERLFKPLGITAGFGGTGTVGKEDQPWPHLSDGSPMPQNGPATDNPASLGPAGTCHMSLKNWCLFLADHLRGAAEKKALLQPESYAELHRPVGEYALGWNCTQRPWAGGLVLTHTGSNTLNYAVCWLAPKAGFGVLSVANQGGDTAWKACDAVCAHLITKHRR